MTILFAILLFSILIFVHELGHFLAAKASGVRVNEFSMFMGPAIFKKQVGDTLEEEQRLLFRLVLVGSGEFLWLFIGDIFRFFRIRRSQNSCVTTWARSSVTTK